MVRGISMGRVASIESAVAIQGEEDV